MTFPFVIGASQQKRSLRPLYMKWRTTTINETVTLPLPSGVNYNFIIDWGDGAVSQITAYNDADRIHTYAVAGYHVSRISGTCEGWSFNYSGDRLKIIEVYGGNGHVFKSLLAGFSGCTNLTKFDCPDLDVSNVTNFGNNIWRTGTFFDCSSLTSIDLSGWVFSTVSDISFGQVFEGCTNLTTIVGIGGWNTEKIVNFNRLFYKCLKITGLDIGGWVFARPTTFSQTFSNCTSLTSLDLSGWVVSFVTNFYSTFSDCSNLTTIGDTSGWNTSNVTSFSGTFSNCRKLTSIDVSGWDVSNTTDISNMFYNCYVLSSLNVTSWDVSNVKNMQGTFSNCKIITSLNVSGWNVSKVTNFGTNIWLTGTFHSMKALTSLDLSSWTFNTTDNVSFQQVFEGCSNLTTIGDTSGWNTSKFTSVFRLFYGCSKLTSIDMGGWDVSSCTNFNNFFYGCTGLTSIDVSGWTLNTSTNVTMVEMFHNCSSLTSLSFTGWNTSKVTNFQQFLDECTSLSTCDVSVLSTAAATNVSYMFRNCRSMTAINISGWDLSLVTASNMTQYMFNGCYALTSLTLPASLSRVDNQFAVFTGTPAITVYNINRAAAPTVSGTPFGNYAKPLHVPVGATGYDVAPWTNTAIFSSIINDL